MAKNWKRAHDAVLLQCAALQAKLNIVAIASHDQSVSLVHEREQRRVAENNLSLACSHMEAAADQLLTRDACSTAALLRREADRLCPFKAMAVTSAKDEQR